MLQAPIFDGLSFDPFTLFDDGLCSSEVGVCRRHIVQALVVALVVVMCDERLDLRFEIAGQEVVFQQYAVLQGLVPKNRGHQKNRGHVPFFTTAPQLLRPRRKPHPKPLAERPPHPGLQVKGRNAAASRFHP